MSFILANTFAVLAAAGAVGPLADFEIEHVQNMTRISYSQPLVSKDRPAGPVIIGGGVLEIILDGNDLTPSLLSKYSEGGYYATYELGIDPNGAVKTCKSFAYGGPSLIDTHICRAIGKTAQFKFTPGYELDAPVGYVPIFLSWSTRKHIADPIVFHTKDAGIPISITYTKAAKAKAAECAIYDDDITDAEKLITCNALKQSNRFQTKLLRVKKPKYGVSNQFWVNSWVKAKNPLPAAESTLKWGQNYYDSSPAAYTYPNAMPANAKMITPSIGKFFMELKNSERPDLNEPKYSRYAGVATLAIAINPDGSVNSCKPYISSQAAGLDIKACQIAVERGRFVFTAGKPNDTDLRYIKVPVEWPEATPNE